MARKYEFQYQAVTGAAMWGNPGSLADARKRVMALQAEWPSVEIERIAFVGLSNGRRYWRFRSGKWSTDFTSDPSPADLARWRAVAPSVPAKRTAG